MDIYLNYNSCLNSSKSIGCKRKSISSSTSSTSPIKDIESSKINNNNLINNNNINSTISDNNDNNNNNNNNNNNINQNKKIKLNQTNNNNNNICTTTITTDNNNNNKDKDKDKINNNNNNSSSSGSINLNNNKDNKSSTIESSFQYFKQVQEKYVKEWDWKSASKKAFSTDQTLKVLEPKQAIKGKSKSSSSTTTTTTISNTNSLEQTVIDAGQKNVGQMVCQKCKMLYSYGSKEDEIAHQSYCNGNIQQQKVIIKNWQSFKILKMFHNGQGIISVNRDNTSIQSKVNQLKQIINIELGFTGKVKQDTNDQDDQDEKLFLYVDSNGRVLGCLIAERVEKGYQIQVSSPTIQCVATPTKILCGISRIWVLPSHRKRGIALKLLDSFRSNMFYGYHLKNIEFAVTQPSTSGLLFFTNYFKTNHFLLYNINQ